VFVYVEDDGKIYVFLTLIMALSSDNELKRLLASPAKNASDEGSMAPPLTVSKNIFAF
jgi:hypothetical protein